LEVEVEVEVEVEWEVSSAVYLKAVTAACHTVALTASETAPDHQSLLVFFALCLAETVPPVPTRSAPRNTRSPRAS
jgi:hypothetical protein